MEDDLFTLWRNPNNDNTQKQEDIKEVETNSNETNIVSETTTEVTKDESVSSDDNTEGVTNAEVVSNTENTKNTENNNTLAIVEKEEQEEVKEGEVIQTREVDRYIKVLQETWGSSYDIYRMGDTSNEVLCKVLTDRQGRKIPIKLTNILPVMLNLLEYTNGEDTENKYNMVAYVLDRNDKKLGPFVITEKELSKLTSAISNRFIGEVINYSDNSDKKMREIVELIGRESVEKKVIHTNTGFDEHNGNRVFLYHGGYIGNTDTDVEIETDLTDYNIPQYCFTDKEFDLKESLETEYSLLELADLKIMIPLIAITYLSSLFSILQEEGILVNFVLLIVGKTGTYKSSISSLSLNHFGKFALNEFPLSFRSTFAGLEKVAFAAKDVLLVVDDYKPETMETDQEKIMEGIMGLWGDRHSRNKMNSKGGLHKKYAPRGLAIVTGERPPKFSQSRLARAITIYTQEGSIDFEKLKELFKKKEQLNFAMRVFIEWIISNEEDIRTKAKELQDTYSTNVSEFKHPRIKQNIVVMMIGFTFWLDFLVEYSIIDSNKRDELINKAYTELEVVGRNQENDVEDEDPVKVFFKTIGQLQIAGKAYLTDYETGLAIDVASGTHIGYIDNKNNQYYLIADTVYKEVEKACIGRFTATPKQLWKSLLDEGYITTDKDNRKVIRRTDPKTKNKVECIIISKSKWLEAMGNEEIPAP